MDNSSEEYSMYDDNGYNITKYLGSNMGMYLQPINYLLWLSYQALLMALCGIYKCGTVWYI